MSVQFPPWYKGAGPNLENVTVNLLQPHLNGIMDGAGNPTPAEAVTELMLDYAGALPLVQIYRHPGIGIDADTRVDHALIEVGVIANTRDDSWAIFNFCQTILLAKARGGHVAMPGAPDVLLDSVGVMNGPTLLQELNPDLRLVNGMFHMAARPPRGLPNYPNILNS